MDPKMPTPSAPPTWRTVSLMADPTPAWESGSAAMTASVAGAIVFAPPIPNRNSETPATQYAVVTSRPDSAVTAVPRMSRLRVTVHFVQMRPTSMALMGAPNMNPMAIGTSLITVSSGE